MRFLILTGGISSEREIALQSAKNLENWIARSGNSSETFDIPQDLQRFLRYIASEETFENIIPMFHGKFGEDGQITAFIEMLGYNYAFSDFSVHALCIDKNLTNLALTPLGFNMPQSILLKRRSPHISNAIGFPCIVKPNRGGSSIATQKVEDVIEYQAACGNIQDDDILVQQCIVGREFTVGVYLKDQHYYVLPIIEIKTSSGDFFDYSEKYETDGSNEVFMDEEDVLQKKLSDESLRICEYLGTKGVVRLDWIYDGKDIYFLEVNTIPGFTSGSLVPKMWKQAGKNEKEFMEMLIA